MRSCPVRCNPRTLRALQLQAAAAPACKSKAMGSQQKPSAKSKAAGSQQEMQKEVRKDRKAEVLLGELSSRWNMELSSSCSFFDSMHVVQCELLLLVVPLVSCVPGRIHCPSACCWTSSSVCGHWTETDHVCNHVGCRLQATVHAFLCTVRCLQNSTSSSTALLLLLVVVVVVVGEAEPDWTEPSVPLTPSIQ
jgi:hypothetical protein